MSLFDKISGRFKKAAGDLAGDPNLRAKGAREERKGKAKEEAAEAAEAANVKAREVADLERRSR